MKTLLCLIILICLCSCGKDIIEMKQHEIKYLSSRMSSNLMSYNCFCEVAGNGQQTPQCTLSWDANGKPKCAATNCTDCDIEFCYDGIRLPDTRGGGIAILNDTVLITSNQNVIFGWKTKITLEYESNDTLFFRRESLVDSNLIFDQRLYNATGVPDIYEEIENYNLWLIPYNKNIPAFRIYAPPSCNSSTTEPCDDECELETEDNCSRCKCCGTGDCDMTPGIKGIVVNSIYLHQTN